MSFRDIHFEVGKTYLSDDRQLYTCTDIEGKMITFRQPGSGKDCSGYRFHRQAG